jgi:hypothetical protein
MEDQDKDEEELEKEEDESEADEPGKYESMSIVGKSSPKSKIRRRDRRPESGKGAKKS